MLFTDTSRLFETLRLSETAAVVSLNEAGIQDVTDATRGWFESSLARLAQHCGDRRIDDVDARTLHDWHRALCATASATTANSYLRAVHTVFSRLVRRGLLAANPAAYVPYAKEPPRRPKAVSEATYLRLRAAAVHARDRALVDVLWSTGCRLGGLLSMRLGGLEFWPANGELRLAALVTEKFGATRYVYARSPQSNAVRDWLGERPAVAHDAVFLNIGDRAHGSPMTKVGAQHVLRRLRDAAGVEDAANAHAFRHAFAIRKLDEGHDLSAVAAWLGHSDPSFTAKVYVNRREDELRRKWFGE